MSNKIELKIKCEDGFELSGTVFNPTEVKAAILIAPATGLKQQFYNSFATYLSENGFGVLTFDNRGIGKSKGKSINGVNASLINWGKLDMTAALESLKLTFPNVDYHLIGHSAGGQLVGLMKNSKELKSMFNYGSSSGSLKLSKYPFKLKSLFWFKIYIPISNLFFGHTKSQWVGMGEPLPKLVATDWKRWCAGTGYVKVDLDTSIKDHLYDELSMNSMWLHAKDDDIATVETVNDMIRVFSKVNSQLLTLDPDNYGFKDLGHMKFFSSKKRELWGLALTWLNEN